MADSLRQFKRLAEQYSAEYNHACRQIDDERDQLARAKRRVQRLQVAQQILQKVAQAIQTAAHERIAGVVTECLQAIFGDEAYEFRILFERKRGHTAARLVFVRAGVEIDPMTAAGGGVVDVAAFALRVACLVLHRPPLRRVLVLDEPFRFLSSQYRPRVAEMLEMLAKKLGIQFVLVTHDPALQIGRIISL